MNRRHFLNLATAIPLAGVAAPLGGLVREAWAEARTYTPVPGAWRNYEVTTRVEVLEPSGVTRVWLPLPSIDSDYQKSLDDRWNAPGARTEVAEDAKYGARMLVVEFPAGTSKPVVELVSRVSTRDRATDWSQKGAAPKEDQSTLALWLQPTELMPTDGIVHRTAVEAVKGKRSDRDKAQALYDWVVTNAYREPKTRGCGVGDIKAMLESGDLGGKCADLNALFVGMARSVGIPARDVYGVRLAPSAFGYKALGGNSANITRAQHCRAEVYLADYGWVAMDPADVTKVMREETSQWIRNLSNPLVAPVKQALFGSWEGNWFGYNVAHDIALPSAKGPKVGFLMYPQAETDKKRLDSLDPDHFRYAISARAV